MVDVNTRRNKIEENAPRLLAAIKKGCGKLDSCRVADISPPTLANLLKRAEELDAPDEYIQFYFDYHEARAKGLDKLLKDLDKFDNKTEQIFLRSGIVAIGVIDAENARRCIPIRFSNRHGKCW